MVAVGVWGIPPAPKDVYQEVLTAVALRLDLESLVEADHTDIGERGINLSGGQKARVGRLGVLCFVSLVVNKLLSASILIDDNDVMYEVHKCNAVYI